MPSTKRKNDEPSLSTPTKKKKMTLAEKQAARARAQAWAKQEATSLNKNSTSKERPSMPKRVTQRPTTKQNGGHAVLASPPPVYSNVATPLLKQTGTNGTTNYGNNNNKKETKVSVPIVDDEATRTAATDMKDPAMTSSTESRWLPCWVVLLVVWLVLGNVVLGGLLIHTKMEHQVLLWKSNEPVSLQQQQEPPTRNIPQQDDKSNDFSLQVEKLQLRIAELEGQKRGLQEEFTELLEELMEERAHHD